MVVQEDDEDEKVKRPPKLPITLHISEGYKHLRLLQYEKAIPCFDLALEIQPTNLQSLIGKTKCLIRLAKHDEARQIAEYLLDFNPKWTEALFLKGEIEYLHGNFEQGFLDFWMGYKIRPNCSILKLGHQMCRKAIDNSLDPDSPFLLDQSDVQEVDEIMEFGDKKQIDRAKGNYLPKYSLNTDLKFVKLLLNDNDLSSISPLCQDLFDYLKERSKFERIRNPDTKKGPGLDSRKMLDLLFRKRKRAEKSIFEGDICTCKQTALEALNILSKKQNHCTLEIMTEKAHLLHVLGLAHMFDDNVSSALKYHKQQLEISENYIPEFESVALRNIGEDYLKSQKFEDALTFFQRCLKCISSDKEESIVLYKIADCELNLNRLGNAGEYARKSLEIATVRKEFRLQCDLTMLLAEIAVRRRHMKKAEGLYSAALTIAEQNDDFRLDEIKKLIYMFHDKLEDENADESVHQLSEELEKRRRSIKTDTGFLTSKRKEMLIQQILENLDEYLSG